MFLLRCIQTQILYKWVFSEGLNFVWEDKVTNLDSVFKAHKFAIDIAQKLGYQPSSEESLRDTEMQPRDTQQSTSRQGATGEGCKASTLLRPRTIAKKCN